MFSALDILVFICAALGLAVGVSRGHFARWYARRKYKRDLRLKQEAAERRQAEWQAKNEELRGKPTEENTAAAEKLRRDIIAEARKLPPRDGIIHAAIGSAENEDALWHARPIACADIYPDMDSAELAEAEHDARFFAAVAGFASSRMNVTYANDTPDAVRLEDMAKFAPPGFSIETHQKMIDSGRRQNKGIKIWPEDAVV